MTIARSAKMTALRLCRPMLSSLDRRELRRFAATAGDDGQLFADAIGRLHSLDNEGSADLSAIDQERRQLAACHDPIVDNSLGDPMPWDVGVTVSQACADSKQPRPALLLYWLIRRLRPKKILELGCNVGISAAYMAAALRANGEGGQLWTLDGSAYRQRLAKQTISNLGFEDIVHFEFGDFHDILPRVLEEQGSFDAAFIDGNHQLEPTLDFTRMILERADEDPVIVYDDIRWSPGMKEAWRQLRTHDQMLHGVDLYSVALCRMSRDGGHAPRVTKPLVSVLYGPEPKL